MGHAHSVYFDTLYYANELKDAGVAPKEAEAQTRVLAEVFGDHIATKQDISDLKHEISVQISDLKHEISSARHESSAMGNDLRTEINAMGSELRAEIKALDTKFELKFAEVGAEFVKVDARFSQMKTEILKWVFGIVLGVAAAQSALMFSLLKFMH